MWYCILLQQQLWNIKRTVPEALCSHVHPFYTLISLNVEVFYSSETVAGVDDFQWHCYRLFFRAMVWNVKLTAMYVGGTVMLWVDMFALYQEDWVLVWFPRWVTRALSVVWIFFFGTQKELGVTLGELLLELPFWTLSLNTYNTVLGLALHNSWKRIDFI